MDGRTSQHSPTALLTGAALEDTRLHAGDQETTAYGPQPRTRKTGYTLLLAAEALPAAFLEETEEDAQVYSEPGDQQVRQAVEGLKRSIERYNVCWCSAPERIAGDLHRVFVAPTPELLHTIQALPLFFSDEELEAALRMAPAPRRSLRPPTPSAQAASPGAIALPCPELSTTPASTSAQDAQSERITVFASIKTLKWAFGTLKQNTKEKEKKDFSFQMRQLWLLRAALQAILRDHQGLPDLQGTDFKVRRVLVCRTQVRPERVRIEPRYEDWQLVGFELSVLVPAELAA